MQFLAARIDTLAPDFPFIDDALACAASSRCNKSHGVFACAEGSFCTARFVRHINSDVTGCSS
jgi:hypothetical protein